MSLRSSKSQLPGCKQKMSGAYCLISIIHTFAAFQLVTMNVRNNGVGVCHVTPDTGNDGVGV